jgi:hypothetical protein
MFVLTIIKNKGFDIYYYYINMLKFILKKYYLNNNRKRVRYDMNANIEYDHIIYDDILIGITHDTNNSNDTNNFNEWTYCQIEKYIFDNDCNYFIGHGVDIEK